MDFAIWTENLSVEIELIDNQHKQLIKMINEIASMVLKHQETDVLAILNGLQEYTETHFSEEEDLFRKSEYPDVDKHVKEHGYFIAKLDEFEKDYNKEDVSLSLNLLQFLKDWLFYHIEIVDASYASYVRKINELR